MRIIEAGNARYIENGDISGSDNPPMVEIKGFLEQTVVPEMTTKPVNHQVAIIPRNKVRRHLTAPPAIELTIMLAHILLLETIMI